MIAFVTTTAAAEPFSARQRSASTTVRLKPDTTYESSYVSLRPRRRVSRGGRRTRSPGNRRRAVNPDEAPLGGRAEPARGVEISGDVGASAAPEPAKAGPHDGWRTSMIGGHDRLRYDYRGAEAFSARGTSAATTVRLKPDTTYESSYAPPRPRRRVSRGARRTRSPKNRRRAVNPDEAPLGGRAEPARGVEIPGDVGAFAAPEPAQAGPHDNKVV
jgi:hypothetical protein